MKLVIVDTYGCATIADIPEDAMSIIVTLSSVTDVKCEARIPYEYMNRILKMEDYNK
jgi:hypothetical protein